MREKVWVVAPPPENAGREGRWAEPGAAGWRWPGGGLLAGSTIFRCFLYFTHVLCCPLPAVFSRAAYTPQVGNTPQGAGA